MASKGDVKGDPRFAGMTEAQIVAEKRRLAREEKLKTYELKHKVEAEEPKKAEATDKAKDDAEKKEKEKIEKDKAENERLEKEKAEKEKLDKAKEKTTVKVEKETEGKSTEKPEFETEGDKEKQKSSSSPSKAESSPRRNSSKKSKRDKDTNKSEAEGDKKDDKPSSAEIPAIVATTAVEEKSTRRSHSKKKKSHGNSKRNSDKTEPREGRSARSSKKLSSSQGGIPPPISEDHVELPPKLSASADSSPLTVAKPATTTPANTPVVVPAHIIGAPPNSLASSHASIPPNSSDSDKDVPTISVPLEPTPTKVSTPQSTTTDGLLKVADPLSPRQRATSVSASLPTQKAPPRLTHMTKNRAKAGPRNRSGSSNPVRNRPGVYKTLESEGKKKNLAALANQNQADPVVLTQMLGNLKSAEKRDRSRSNASTPSEMTMASLVKFDALKMEQSDDEERHEPKGALFDPKAVLDKGRKSTVKVPPKPKMLRISGKNRIHVRQVSISATELNDANVFVYNSLDAIWVWHGKKVNKMERATALDVQTRMNRNEYGGRAKVHFLESGQEGDEFWKKLGGKVAVKDVSVGEEIREKGKDWDVSDTLHVFDLNSEQYVLVEGKRTQDQLKNDRSFVLDCGDEFFIWHGSKIGTDDRLAANTKAEELFKAKPRASWVEIERASQGGEGILFISKFLSWTSEATLSGSEDKSGNVAKSKYEKLQKMDVGYMHTLEKPEKVKPMDDGKDGKTQIWIVNEGTKKELPESEWGQFYSQKSYIIMYNWLNYTRFHIYFWQGSDSTVSDKGSSAGVVMDLNALLCRNSAIQERVPQYKEPEHFHLMFQHKFVEHHGDSRDPTKDTRLYHGRGTELLDTKLVEVDLNASRLYTADVFVLTTPSKVYFWHGKASTKYLQDEIRVIVENCTKKSLPYEIVAEGSEPSAFWSSLGGKKDYTDKVVDAEVKVFYCDNKLGVFRADRVFEFAQSDLNTHKQSIIDSGNATYVWLGASSKQQDNKLALELAKEFIEKTPNGRKRTGYYVQEGHEPPAFAALFHGFRFQRKGEGGFGPIDELLGQFSQTFSYEQLKSKRETLPAFVDKSRLEDYLSAEDFEKVFGCSREDYAKKPAWKALEEKKKSGLY